MEKAVPLEVLQKWQEMVQNSNGQMMFIPEAFREEWEKLNERRQEIQEENLKITAKATKHNIAFTNWWLKIQEHLEVNGVPNVWAKELGENADALKAGLGVINISEPLPGMPGR